MMTNRWINVVLAVVVTVGLAGVAIYERPHTARERAELLGQEVVDLDIETPLEPTAPQFSPGERTETASPEASPDDPGGPYGVSAGHPVAVEVGMQVLEAGGNAVDAAVAVSYTLGVVEPFGSGIGGGGAMVIHAPGAEPVAYDYREIAPSSGEIPASDIGVPGFVAGMAHVHEQYGVLGFETLIEPAISLADGGVEVNEILNERLRGAAHRLPVHQIPQFFPDGAAIEPGAVLVQPEYAEALRAIRDGGPEVMYGGALGEQVAEAVGGLELSDLEAYQVEEIPVARGTFAGYDVLGAGPPVSGPTLVQQLQILEAAGIADLAPESPEYYHLLAQSYRVALADRAEYVADPTFEDVPLDALLATSYAEQWAGAIPSDGFADVGDERALAPSETDTTHFVVVDGAGTMVSATNTLSNFFGSGLAVSGFFLNDQGRNYSRDPESVNAVAPGKRSRSFITPVILARDGEPVLGIGSPGGRRIPAMVAQILVLWAAHGMPIDEAVAAPRVHVEGRDLEFEVSPANGVASELGARGYTVVDDIPFLEYFGAAQILLVDPDTGELTGVADDRRQGTWRSSDQD